MAVRVNAGPRENCIIPFTTQKVAAKYQDAMAHYRMAHLPTEELCHWMETRVRVLPPFHGARHNELIAIAIFVIRMVIFTTSLCFPNH